MSFRNVALLAALVTTGLLSGCVHLSTYRSAHRAPTKEVEIFRDGARPNKTIREIGHISTEAPLSKQARVEARFLKHARSLGGQAILLNPVVSAGSVYHFSGEIVVFE